LPYLRRTGLQIRGLGAGEVATQRFLTSGNVGRSCGRWIRTALLGAVFAVALAGCALSNGPGSFIVDPGKYDGYHCNDLVARWKQLGEREKELRNLMDRAAQSAGGGVIGQVVYRSDYESVLTEQRIVQQRAAERKCELTATYQSDSGIH
jgi:hypothetical protein